VGSIEGYRTRAGQQRYRARYRKPDRSQAAKRGFKTKAEARTYLATIEVDLKRGAYVDPSRSRVTVEAWMAEWLDARTDFRASTRSRNASIVAKHIIPRLGRINLADLSHLDLQKWAGTLPGSPATVQKVVRVVKSTKRYLTHEQVRLLADAVGRRANGSLAGYDTLTRLLAYAGLRWGEAAGLRVRDVDVAAGRISVRQTVIVVDGKLRVEAPKTYEERVVAVPAFIVNDLERLIQGRAADSPVFRGTRTGSWLRNHSFRGGWFDDAAVEVGLPGLTIHELRHTAASLAISSGANVKAVQRMLGHASAKTTLDTYADLFDDDFDSLARRLDAAARDSNVTSLRPAASA
jgi:integrase